MTDQEFDNYLSLLGGVLRLNAGQREAIRNELKAHLEERLDELVEFGKDRDQAVSLALAEFGDAATLAQQFSRVNSYRKRRWMMRFTTLTIAGSFVAVVMLASMWPDQSRLAVTKQATAQDDPFAGGAGMSSPPVTVDESSLVEKKLDEFIRVEFFEDTITDVIDTLQEKLEVDFFMKDIALEKQGVGGDEPVTMSFRRVRASMFLELMLEPYGLTYLIRDGIVIVTSNNDAEVFHEVRVYNCRALIAKLNQKYPAGAEAGGPFGPSGSSDPYGDDPFSGGSGLGGGDFGGSSGFGSGGDSGYGGSGAGAGDPYSGLEAGDDPFGPSGGGAGGYGDDGGGYGGFGAGDGGFGAGGGYGAGAEGPGAEGPGDGGAGARGPGAGAGGPPGAGGLGSGGPGDGGPGVGGPGPGGPGLGGPGGGIGGAGSGGPGDAGGLGGPGSGGLGSGGPGSGGPGGDGPGDDGFGGSPGGGSDDTIGRGADDSGYPGGYAGGGYPGGGAPDGDSGGYPGAAGPAGYPGGGGSGGPGMGPGAGPGIGGPGGVTPGGGGPGGGGIGGGGPSGGFSNDETQQLIMIISETIDSESWSTFGGPGKITGYNGLIIVRQNPKVHRQIQDLLMMLDQSVSRR